MRGQISSLRWQISGLTGQIKGFKGADFRPDRANQRLERADFRSIRVDFRPEKAWERQTDGRMNRQIDGQKSPCVLQDVVPSEVLPCFLSLQYTNMQSRATGIADHILSRKKV